MQEKNLNLKINEPNKKWHEINWKKFMEKFKETQLIKKISDSTEERVIHSDTKMREFFGKQKLSKRNEMRTLKKQVALFLGGIMEEEKKKGEKDSPLIRIYRSRFLKHFSYSFLFVYGTPTLFMIYTRKLRQLGVFRFILLSPFILFFRHFINAVNLYTLNKESLVLLFALDQFYKEDKEVYTKYLEFMAENHIQLIKRDDVKK
jgi:hypothetical protein